MAKSRFAVLILPGVLAACAGFGAWVLASTPWAQARQLDAFFPFYAWRISAFTAATYRQVGLGLGGGAALLALAAVAQLLLPGPRTEARHLRAELGRACRGLARPLRALSQAERRLALAALLGITALRVYFSLVNPEYDDAVSYEVFVSKGLLATGAYYPIPNNHVFSNILSLLFYQLSPGFWWSMRLPVLLWSTLATAGWFAGLLRLVGFRVALLAVGLFGMLHLSLYHAGVGRGYWLMIGLTGIVFFSTLELGRARGLHRAAGLGLVVAGILGCYTVPPFVYVLASAYTWLGLAALRHRHWSGLGLLMLAGLATLAGAALLYTPLVLVSGLRSLTSNGYVASLAPGEFWRGLPAYLWHTEGFLAGQRTLGGLVTLGGLGLLAAGHWRRPADSQSPTPRAALERAALWFMLFPYVLILGQRVFPPERVLLYKAQFFFILLAGVLARWLEQPLTPASRRLRRRLAGAGIGLFCLYGALAVVRVNPAAESTDAAYHAGLHWLATQPAGPVLLPEPTQNLFFRFYAHTQVRGRAWQLDYTQRPGRTYAYVVAFPQKHGYFQPEFPFAPAYRNAAVEIYRVPAGYPLQSARWLH